MGVHPLFEEIRHWNLSRPHPRSHALPIIYKTIEWSSSDIVSLCSGMPLQPEISWTTHPTPVVASVDGRMLVRRLSDLFIKYAEYIVHAAPASTQR